MDKTILTGNLGQDAERKARTVGGYEFVVFSLAHTEKYADKEVTDWYNCYIQFDWLLKSKVIDFLVKGTKVLLEGQKKAQIWIKDDGTPQLQYVFNVNNIELIGGQKTDTGRNDVPNVIAKPEPVQSTSVNVVKPEVIPGTEEQDLPF